MSQSDAPEDAKAHIERIGSDLELATTNSRAEKYLEGALLLYALPYISTLGRTETFL